MKKFCTIAIVTALLCGSVAATTIESIPKHFWYVNDNYLGAVEQDMHHDVITYGLQGLDILMPLPESDTTDSLFASRLYQISLAHEALDHYNAAAAYFEPYIPYAQKMGWDDGVKIARAKIKQYTT